MIEYTISRAFGVDRYDAKVGFLHVGTQDNGEGWWNWWIALAEQGPAAGDRAIVKSGGEPRLHLAKERIAVECSIIAYAIHAIVKTEADAVIGR